MIFVIVFMVHSSFHTFSCSLFRL